MFANTKNWHRVILWLLVIKVGYLAVIYSAVKLWSDFDEEKFREITARWFPDVNKGGPVFASHFGTWDGAHYLYLSEVGYVQGVKSCAFYPLWPLTIRWFSILTGGSHVASGMVLANVFSLGAWTIFYQVTSRRFGQSVALWALVFLIVFPGSLFYQFTYSEPLFFLLVMLLWLGLEQERYGLAWLAAFLLPLTRGVGVFGVLPIGWHWLMKQPWAWLDQWPLLDAERQRRRTDSVSGTANVRWPGVWLLAQVLGWAVYLGLMCVWTDNPWEGIQAQRFWGVHSITNLVDLPKFVVGLFTPTQFHDFRGSMLDRCLFILLLYTLPLVWRLGKDLMVWTYVLGILPAMSGTFTSLTRYESTVFPMFIALAVFFTSRKQTWPLVVFIIFSAALHAILLWRFVNFRWAG